jgi:hypothetical protein
VSAPASEISHIRYLLFLMCNLGGAGLKDRCGLPAEQDIPKYITSEYSSFQTYAGAMCHGRWCS